MQFDLTDLRLFVEVADAQSITHGAARAHLALASASARIKNLEQSIGTQLLIRSRRGVTLTAAGESLRDHGRIVLHDIETMRGDLASHARGSRATIHLLTNTAGLTEHLPRPLATFLRAHPTINVDVEERESVDIVAAIAAGVADLGIAVDRHALAAITRYPFCRDTLMLVVSARDPLAKRRSLAFGDAVTRAFVGLEPSSALQGHVAKQAAQLGARITYRARVKGFDAVCQLVAAGVGVAVLPESTARRFAKTLPLQVVRLKDTWATRDLMICVRDAARLSAPVRDLVTHLRAAGRTDA